MVAKHSVKVNGVWYRAGEEIAPALKNDFSIDGKAVGKVKEDVIEITDEEVIKENQFTKTEINRMSTADLKELAKLNGIDDGLSGAEIKKALIEKFEL